MVIQFVIVRGRQPFKGPLHCACCCEKLKDGYIHEIPTGLRYCDMICFKFSIEMAMLAIEDAARRTS